jgi:hypothetical protein
MHRQSVCTRTASLSCVCVASKTCVCVCTCKASLNVDTTHCAHICTSTSHTQRAYRCQLHLCRTHMWLCAIDVSNMMHALWLHPSTTAVRHKRPILFTCAWVVRLSTQTWGSREKHTQLDCTHSHCAVEVVLPTQVSTALLIVLICVVDPL